MKRFLISAASAALLLAMAVPVSAGVPLSNREAIREKVMYKVHKVQHNGVTVVRTHDGSRFEETRTGRDGKVHKDSGRWWAQHDRLCYMYDKWHNRQMICGRVEIEGPTQIVFVPDNPPPPPDTPDRVPLPNPPTDTPITVIDWRDAPPGDSPNGIGGGSPGGGSPGGGPSGGGGGRS